MKDNLHHIIDICAGISCSLSTLNLLLSTVNLVITIIAGVLTIVWFSVRFYDRFKRFNRRNK